MIERWVADNPPGHGVGWESYPLSLRIVNWIKWNVSEDSLDTDTIASLFDQTAYLCCRLETHLLGNHLLANAKALLFAGLYFDGRQANRWLNTARRVLCGQIREQFLSDGGHFELSPTYHAQLTEDLFDIIQISRLYDHDCPDPWLSVANRALRWLAIMTSPDGSIALFNDSAQEVAPPLVDLLAYARRLQLLEPSQLQPGLVDLAASGYTRYEGSSYSIFVDAGPIGPDYIPGHGHCDMLSFELFVSGRPMIVDTGVSTYERGERRQLERSTESHNTVQIGALEQSEIWAAFRVGRRARIIKRSVGNDWIEASHDGFASAGAIHSRFFKFEDCSVEIIDTLQRHRESRLPSIARFHFHPDVRLKLLASSAVTDSMRLDFDGARKIDISDYHYARTFNVLMRAPVLEVEFDSRLKTRIDM